LSSSAVCCRIFQAALQVAVERVLERHGLLNVASDPVVGLKIVGQFDGKRQGAFLALTGLFY
tara:strand:- start:231 stop:416 length:186 start_codon:yes stop_codon:yes gene_type:complete